MRGNVFSRLADWSSQRPWLWSFVGAGLIFLVTIAFTRFSR